MDPKVLDALRRIVYHKLNMWDAANEAEKLVSKDIETGSVELEELCFSLDNPVHAFALSEAQLKQAFPSLWVKP